MGWEDEGSNSLPAVPVAVAEQVKGEEKRNKSSHVSAYTVDEMGTDSTSIMCRMRICEVELDVWLAAAIRLFYSHTI